ncbi:hypothetical protein LG3211_3545 [Lysobacter gummosus]|nr:hypothetical protein LG3211_3545 [Lysobacter gummosus]
MSARRSRHLSGPAVGARRRCPPRTGSGAYKRARGEATSGPIIWQTESIGLRDLVAVVGEIDLVRRRRAADRRRGGERGAVAGNVQYRGFDSDLATDQSGLFNLGHCLLLSMLRRITAARE